MKKSGVRPISFICDNCPLNQGVYHLLGGPGRVVMDNIEVFLMYDFVHIMKNLRNNWLTEKLQELSFMEDGTEYLARWKDIQALYEEDRNSSLRLTKLTHTSVFPKPLQRQSVPLVCQVFHEKTIAALKALKNTINPQEGTIRFITLVTNWFKMMNVKDKFGAINLRDPFRAPWTLNCENFNKLLAMCDVIGSCRWEGGKMRQKNLTKFTADAFIVTTKSSIAAATYLLTHHHFEFVLPAVFSQDPLEKFFGQARQRHGGNFYIDVGDVISAGKVQSLHQMLKYNVIPQGCGEWKCSYCTAPITLQDIDLMQETCIEDIQVLLDSTDALKHKVVFIAGFLTYKHGDP